MPFEVYLYEVNCSSKVRSALSVHVAHVCFEIIFSKEHLIKV